MLCTSRAVLAAMPLHVKGDTMSTRLVLTLVSAFLLFAVAASPFGCTRSTEADQQAVREAVLSLMDTQLKAVNAGDVDAVLALFDSSPEFLACLDGEVLNAEQFVKAEREGFDALRSVPTSWDTVYVRVLFADLAIALAPFHQVQVDANGVETRWTGDVTCIARLRNGKWTNIYAHAVHRPDASPR